MKRAPTLARHLLAWVLGGLVLVWLTFIVAGYRAGQHEADELTDGHLASAAALMTAYSGGQFGTEGASRPTAEGQLRAHDYQQSLSVVVWDAQGRVLTRTGDAPEPPFAVGDGFATLQLGTPARNWRAFTRWNTAHDRKVTVLLSHRERDDLAEDIAQQVVQPALWLLPVVALVLGLAIHRGLKPLYELSADVHALDIQRGEMLTLATRHQELRAAVEAINTLVERYHAALTRERALASEFAHELRTPLASIALQARALRDAPPEEAQALLARLEQDALRAGEVLAHLLALARASRTELDEAAQLVELSALAQRVLAEQAPAALEQGHELALASDGPLQVMGHPVLIELALRNLLENAVHHTPAGTQVEVRVDPQARSLEVSDQPPAGAMTPAGGRALGLGLGHRVVEKIAAIHGARFEAPEPAAGGGRCYRIVFPRALTST